MTRTPPHDIDAERAIIGVALLDTLRATATGLAPDQFYTPAHQHIWAAILQTDRTDPVALAATLHATGWQGDPYTARTLTEYATATPSVANAGRYADTIAELAMRRHLIHAAADITEAAYERSQEQIAAALQRLTSTPTSPSNGLQTVNWAELWADDNDPEEWAIYPLVPRGRSVAMYAAAKTGKSTIVLAAIAAACTGRNVLGTGRQTPVKVLYLDYEMTQADLIERLTLLGYGPDDNLENLHYALLPSLPPLDTAAGAQQLVRHAIAVGAQVVVVDTFGRAVMGDENEADTIRAFYRNTGQALKAAGIACLRTDHAGKDRTKGQRGSSAKNDDVDVVWELSRTDSGVLLKRTHSRITWGPGVLTIDQQQGDGTVDYRERGGEGYPAGTREVMIALDELAIDPTASARKAAAALRQAGHQASNDLIRAAQRARRNDVRLMGHSTTTSAHTTTKHGGALSGAVEAQVRPARLHGALRRAFGDTPPDLENTEEDRAADFAARCGALSVEQSGAPPLYIERRARRGPDTVTGSNTTGQADSPEDEGAGDWPW